MWAGTSRLICSLVVALACVAGCTSGDPSAQPRHSNDSATGSELYVSPTGNDLWPGTESRPWRTLARALPALYAGQTLYVRGGDYREQLTRLNLHEGEADEPIVVTNYPGERPVVHGLVWLRRPSYWTFDGFNVTADPAIQPPPRAMVKIIGGVGWTWRNSEIWGSRGAANVQVSGVEAGEPAHWSLLENCIHDPHPPRGSERGSNVAVVKGVAAGPGAVSRNIIFTERGRQNISLGSTEGRLANVMVTYNTIFGADFAASIIGHTRRVRIARNILGGAESPVLIRWSSLGVNNVVRQNLGVQTSPLQAGRFLRPIADVIIGGPGNVFADDVSFTNVSACTGFRSDAAVAIPYGRYAIG